MTKDKQKPSPIYFQAREVDSFLPLPGGEGLNIDRGDLFRISWVRAVLALLSFLFYACSFAFAQGQAGLTFDVLKAGVGACPLGMGGAFTAVADNSDAPYWNPAGLGRIDKNEITTAQTRLSTDADHYYISYVRPAFGGTIGVSWIQVGLGSITQTSSEVDRYNEVQVISIFSYFSNAYMLSYGRELNKHISFGLTAKYLTSDMFQVPGGQAYGYSVTPGVMIVPRLSFASGEASVGLKIDELLNEQKWGTNTVEKAPPVLRVGLAYRSKNPGLFAIDFSQILKSGYSTEISAGYEWSKDGLSLRVGLNDGGLTAGAGFLTGHTRVDYAYVTQRDLTRENVHRISLTGVW